MRQERHMGRRGTLGNYSIDCKEGGKKGICEMSVVT